MLENKTVLVTGASRGIGKAIALICAKHGAFVGINYHAADKEAKHLFNKIKQMGGDGMLLQSDVSDASAVKGMIKQLIDKRSPIDVLINNAGIYQRNSFQNISVEQWNRILEVNLSACYHLCQITRPHMRSGGRIIFISSQLALKGTPHGADYATSKAGMLGLMRSLALEFAADNITVNAIAPGTIDTDLIGNYSDEKRKKRSKQIPLGRIGKPDEVAKTALFLASDLSSYITGETINVNGGLYIQ